MRIPVVSALTLGCVLVLALVGEAAPRPRGEQARSPQFRPAADSPLSRLWPCGLLLGYISMDLKRRLRRRGYLFGDRREMFRDLISLDGAADRPAALHERRHKPKRDK